MNSLAKELNFNEDDTTTQGEANIEQNLQNFCLNEAFQTLQERFITCRGEAER
jgi:hypothetical protein